MAYRGARLEADAAWRGLLRALPLPDALRAGRRAGLDAPELTRLEELGRE